MSVLDEFGFRKDARRPKQIRNIVYQMQVCPDADGSAYFQQGETKVICAVYGPRECEQRSRISDDGCCINCQFSQTTFATSDRRNRPRGDRRANANNRLLERAFESTIQTNLYPRCQIDLYFEVIETDGGTLAACVNSGSLALSDAGIHMKGLASAAECGNVDGIPCADMSSSEHTDVIPRLTIATISGKEKMIMVEMKNLVHRMYFSKLVKMGLETCAQVHTCLQAAVYESVKKAHKCK